MNMQSQYDLNTTAEMMADVLDCIQPRETA